MLGPPRLIGTQGFSPKIKRPQSIAGKNTVLRCVTTEDSAFIASLRNTQRASKNISPSSNLAAEQKQWIEKYKLDSDQAYFIIQNSSLTPIGTIRIYDPLDQSFCWGSWLLKEDTPFYHAIESALLIYYFALKMGFKKSHADVKKSNTSVWKFHERFGAIRYSENHDAYFYKISEEAIKKAFIKYQKHFPTPPLILY